MKQNVAFNSFIKSSFYKEFVLFDLSVCTLNTINIP